MCTPNSCPSASLHQFFSYLPPATVSRLSKSLDTACVIAVDLIHGCITPALEQALVRLTELSAAAKLHTRWTALGLSAPPALHALQTLVAQTCALLVRVEALRKMVWACAVLCCAVLCCAVLCCAVVC